MLSSVGKWAPNCSSLQRAPSPLCSSSLRNQTSSSVVCPKWQPHDTLLAPPKRPACPLFNVYHLLHLPFYWGCSHHTRCNAGCFLQTELTNTVQCQEFTSKQAWPENFPSKWAGKRIYTDNRSHAIDFFDVLLNCTQDKKVLFFVQRFIRCHHQAAVSTIQQVPNKRDTTQEPPA